jgi:anti-sigma B factor antagonist
VSSPGVQVLEVRGDVDLTTAASLLARSTALLEDAGTRTLVIDLSGADFIDSQGIAFLVRSRNLARQKDIELQLRAVPARVRRVLQITGLETVFSYLD